MKKRKGASFRPYPSISDKKVTGNFDGDPVTSNGGAMLFAAADRRFGISSTLAGAIRDNRDQRRLKHKTVDIVRDRLTAIGSSYPDANDLEPLVRVRDWRLGPHALRLPLRYISPH